jgi:hypothetical protein
MGIKNENPNLHETGMRVLVYFSTTCIFDEEPG